MSETPMEPIDATTKPREEEEAVYSMSDAEGCYFTENEKLFEKIVTQRDVEGFRREFEKAKAGWLAVALVTLVLHRQHNDNPKAVETAFWDVAVCEHLQDPAFFAHLKLSDDGPLIVLEQVGMYRTLRYLAEHAPVEALNTHCFGPFVHTALLYPELKEIGEIMVKRGVAVNETVLAENRKYHDEFAEDEAAAMEEEMRSGMGDMTV